jgi:hypothetical protein
MSSASPLTEAQKAKDKAEAHANPSMVHMQKGKWREASERRASYGR